MTLTGKTAVVTGASSGIGEATARLLAQRGCKVALAARRKDRLKDLAVELGEGALAVPTDVTDPAACEALVSRTVERFGSVDVLVANAGLGLYGSIPDGDPEDWRRMFEVKMPFPRHKNVWARFPRSPKRGRRSAIRDSESLG